MPKRALLPIVALVAALVASACTGERPSLAGDVSAGESTSTTANEHPPSEVAEATGEAVPVYATEGDETPSSTLKVADQVGKHLVFLVVKDDKDWLEVLLPVPADPNTGWVRRANVTITTHDYRIEVAKKGHRLQVFQGETSVFDEPVSVGTKDGPAVGSDYFIKELLEPPDGEGPYGRYVYGLSGATNELSELESGAGVVGIHGTNDPDQLGKDVAQGCLGLSNDAMDKLVDRIGLPLGTPVEIKA